MNKQALNLLAIRRSVLSRNLTAPVPSAEELRTILEIGMRVPDHGKVEPWRVQVLSGDARKELGDRIGATFAEENPEATDDAVANERAKHTRGPLMLVVSCHPNPAKFAKVPLVEQRLSCGALCMNVLIAAQASGYSAQWLTAWPAYHPRIQQALGLEGQAHIVGFVHIGTAVEPPKERPRPKYDDVVSHLQAIEVTG